MLGISWWAGIILNKRGTDIAERYWGTYSDPSEKPTTVAHWYVKAENREDDGNEPEGCGTDGS